MKNKRTKFNVINTRAADSVQKSMKGVVIPRIPATEAFYRHINEELWNGELHR